MKDDAKQRLLKESLEWDVELSVNHETFVNDLLSTFAGFLEQHYSTIYYLLRQYRVKNVNEQQVKIVASFLSYYILNVRMCTERMIRYLVKEVMEEKEASGIMGQLHRLGDFRVIQIIRTPSVSGQKLWERYRFLLTETFLDHTGRFWETET